MSRLMVMLLCGAGCALLVWLLYGYLLAPVRRALPWSAWDVREARRNVGNDYVYVMRAKLSPDAFEKYRGRLGLRPAGPNDAINWVDIPDPPSWWEPPLKGTLSANDVFVHRSGNPNMQAVLVGDKLYVCVWSE